MSRTSTAEANPLTLVELDFPTPKQPELGLPPQVDRRLDIEACDHQTHLTAVAMAVFRAVKDQIVDTEACDDALLKVRRFLTDPQGIAEKAYDSEDGDPLSKLDLRRQKLGQASVRNALLVATGRHRTNIPRDPLEEYVGNQLRMHGHQVERLRGLFFTWEG